MAQEEEAQKRSLRDALSVPDLEDSIVHCPSPQKFLSPAARDTRSFS